MAVYTDQSDLGTLLSAYAYTQIEDVPAATKARYHGVRIKNLGWAVAKVWLHRVTNGGSPSQTNAILLAQPIPSLQEIHVAFEAPLMLQALEEMHAQTDYADIGTANAAVLTTSEIVVAAAAAITYGATTITDTGAAYTASPANGDLVGRRIESGPTYDVYGICTSNTANIITMSGGWINKTTGLAAATPTSGGGGDPYTVLASLRDTRETALPVNLYGGPLDSDRQHLLTSGAAGARKTGRLVGNNAGIATYGTTFQIVRGGWSGGTNPGNANAWEIDSLVRVLLDWVEQA